MTPAYPLEKSEGELDYSKAGPVLFNSRLAQVGATQTTAATT